MCASACGSWLCQRVVDFVNYGSSLCSELHGGCGRVCRCHVELNENKPIICRGGYYPPELNNR